MITLRFVDLGWPVVSPAISFFSRHWSNHVDLMTATDMAVSAVPGGVLERALDLRHPDADRVEMITIPCTDEQRAAALAFARAEIGKPYDYLGVLWFPFRPRWNDPRRWFCSELTAAALHHAGILKVPALLHRVSPGDLYRIVSEAADARSVRPS